MKKWIVFALSLLLSSWSFAQSTEYVRNQKLQVTPEDLSARINSKTNVPIIINVGGEGQIRGALKSGVMKTRNESDLLSLVANTPKSKEIVVYCGCCTLANCENIDRAYNILRKHGYTKVKVLNFETDFDVNWKYKGYPMD